MDVDDGDYVSINPDSPWTENLLPEAKELFGKVFVVVDYDFVTRCFCLMDLQTKNIVKTPYDLRRNLVFGEREVVHPDPRNLVRLRK